MVEECHNPNNFLPTIQKNSFPICLYCFGQKDSKDKTEEK